jgi:hypothetical protein
MTDLTVLSDAQVRALRRALDDGITPTLYRSGGCSMNTLRALARKNCVTLQYGPVADPDGRPYRGIVSGEITRCGRNLLADAERRAQHAAEVAERARIPEQRTKRSEPLLLDRLVNSRENVLAARIDAAFGGAL